MKAFQIPHDPKFTAAAAMASFAADACERLSGRMGLPSKSKSVERKDNNHGTGISVAMTEQ